jgi:hypothetical protein
MIPCLSVAGIRWWCQTGTQSVFSDGRIKILGLSRAIDKDNVEFECYLIGLQVHCLNQPLLECPSTLHNTTGLTLKALSIFQTKE